MDILRLVCFKYCDDFHGKPEHFYLVLHIVSILERSLSVQYLEDIITIDYPFQGQRGRELFKHFQLLNWCFRVLLLNKHNHAMLVEMATKSLKSS